MKFRGDPIVLGRGSFNWMCTTLEARDLEKYSDRLIHFTIGKPGHFNGNPVDFVLCWKYLNHEPEHGVIFNVSFDQGIVNCKECIELIHS